MDDLTPRLRAVCDLHVAEVREGDGRHEYDGRVQDLSRAGVRAGLAQLDDATRADPPLADAHDEAQLTAFADAARVEFGDLELHRRNPAVHLGNLDLACYDRDYAATARRDQARREHLAAWPQAIEAALDALDQVPAPVADALAAAIRGLAAGVPADAGEGVRTAALDAHTRLVTRMEQAAASGDPDAALGSAALSALMGTADALPVDLGRLPHERADAERDRLTERLADSCARIDPQAGPALEVARELVRRDHADTDGVIEAARLWTTRAMDFTREHDLVPYPDGECLVGLAPESRRWAMAMMSPAAPGEPEGPSWYHITPPEPSWPAAEREEWLEVFSDTTLPGITVHEVAPGHSRTSGRSAGREGPVRRTLHSDAFVEGWAHYAEELCPGGGLLRRRPAVRGRRLARGADPRHPAGLRHRRAHGRDDGGAGRAAVRVGHPHHRVGGAVGGPAGHVRPDLRPVHLGQAGDHGPARAGPQGIRAPASLSSRFHSAMFALGSPPLGLLGTAIERG